MNWLAWRQHRKQFMVAGIFLVLFAAFMIPTGLNFWHTYQQALSTCGKTDTCDQLSQELFQSQGDGLLLHLVPVAMMFIPILLGLFWGVPFLAREYGEGTNKLVWTQSISRRKWLSVKLIWALAGAVIIAAGFAVLNTWWAKTGNALNLNRFNMLPFSTQGIVLIGYAIFAVSLGIFFGAWLKRTMAAIGITLFLLIAIVLVAVPNFVRPHYMTPLTKDIVTNQFGPGDNSLQPPANGMIVSAQIQNHKGQILSFSNPPQKCIIPQSELPGVIGNNSVGRHAVKAPGNGGGSIMSVNGGPAISGSCLESQGYFYLLKYQPSYRYWDFQRIEMGLYLGLSVIPIGLTYLLVLKRDA